MSEVQNDKHLKETEKKKIDYEILATMISAPKILQYYVEKGVFLIEDQTRKKRLYKTMLSFLWTRS